MEGQCKVLLVDDEADFADTLVKRLGKRGMDAAARYSGGTALDYLEDHPVDVVVLDVKMPGMDGIDCLRKIKERYPLVEVVLLTGHASLDVAINGMELGAFDYLMKPADMDDLRYKIEDALNRKRLAERRIAREKEKLQALGQEGKA
ncbi:response regulator [Desulfocurvibacter africanus]|uniref:response regulator n=1 Tax=Desulfocurvibacter africanus TaxID=873 RepID=UPI0004279B3B|nr:response regulator [Desulfocurvibacter africanus]